MNDVKETLAGREGTHGHFPTQAACAESIGDAIDLGMRNAARELGDFQRNALRMIAQKVARIACGNPNEPDHWHDIAGYATLVERELLRHGPQQSEPGAASPFVIGEASSVKWSRGEDGTIRR